MDPLSIFGAVAGGISVTSEIVKALDKAISIASSVKEAPELAKSTLRDVATMRSTMLRFQTLLNSKALENRPGIYFPLDDAQNAFLGCVTSLDELESLIRPLSDPKLKSLDMSERLEWAMKDKRINQLSQRVRDAQLSLVLMSTILQQESLMQMQEAIASLSQICQKIAPSVAHLKRRSADLYVIEHRRDGEDEVDDSSTIRPAPAPRPDSIIVSESMLTGDQLSPQDQIDGSFSPRFAFEDALERSRVYRRAPNWNFDDLSYRSSDFNMNALSFLSRLSSSHSSLGRASTISFVALPIFCNDLSNPEHYNFGETYAAVQSTSMGSPASAIPQLLTPPSTPLSPSMPVITGMSRVLKAVKKAFESESPTSPYNSPPTLTSPPRPISPQSEEELWIANSVPTLKQLSQLQMKSSEWHLCHGAGGVPCRGAIHQSLLKTYSTYQVYSAQIDLAKTNGFLDPFRCRGCKLSLAQIVMTRRPGWSSFELWCGSTSCLDSHSILGPCSCFSPQQEYPELANKYLCYRNLSKSEVQCAKCFSFCPVCELKEERSNDSSSLPRNGGFHRLDITPSQRRTVIRNLCSRQQELLDLQRLLFNETRYQSSKSHLSGDIRQLKLFLDCFRRSRGTSEEILALLTERQGALVFRSHILTSLWREKRREKHSNGFSSVAFMYMCEKFDETQELLDRTAKKMLFFDSEVLNF
ncbi:hypothetical protein NM208_g7421 [Fusarium decemcellulare]|uniref:Uncharacterized protein n=1 Tax=Fusarium decemcellulare TaxID=57161 RepID=A0ACC1S9E3_9HYPO|nr:hypothetical protein NM208_g7421 [Fusarium decemcellulare]